MIAHNPYVPVPTIHASLQETGMIYIPFPPHYLPSANPDDPCPKERLFIGQLPQFLSEEQITFIVNVISGQEVVTPGSVSKKDSSCCVLWGRIGSFEQFKQYSKTIAIDSSGFWAPPPESPPLDWRQTVQRHFYFLKKHRHIPRHHPTNPLVIEESHPPVLRTHTTWNPNDTRHRSQSLSTSKCRHDPTHSS